jgi:hypothetical protein
MWSRFDCDNASNHTNSRIRLVGFHKSFFEIEFDPLKKIQQNTPVKPSVYFLQDYFTRVAVYMGELLQENNLETSSWTSSLRGVPEFSYPQDYLQLIWTQRGLYVELYLWWTICGALSVVGYIEAICRKYIYVGIESRGSKSLVSCQIVNKKKQKKIPIRQ